MAEKDNDVSALGQKLNHKYDLGTYGVLISAKRINEELQGSKVLRSVVIDLG